MPEQTAFSHIKVTPATQDEEVIVAGSTAVDSAAAFSAEETVASAGNVSNPQMQDTPATVQKAVDDAGIGAISQTPSEKTDAYHETTMDDIKSSKMSGMQKGIVVVAILIIIAFVVYSVVA